MRKLFFSILFFPNLINGQIISTYAGIGTSGYNGDRIPATNAKIGYINGIATDNLNNLYIADGNNQRIRKIDAITGVITTVAGNGTPGFSGDGGPATNAQINSGSECDITLDTAGNLYISDEFNFRIRKVTKATGIITTIAGSGTQHHYGDDGPASTASFGSVNDITSDVFGNIYINDSGGWIRKISQSGIITTVAGIGIYGNTGNGGPATAAEIACGTLACNSVGNLYFTSQPGVIRKIDFSTGVITNFAGIGDIYCYPNDSILSADSACLYAKYITFDHFNQLYLSQPSVSYSRVRKIDTFGILQPVAGNGANGFSGDDGPATDAQLSYPRGLAFDTSGNLYIADMQNLRIRKITYDTSNMDFSLNSSKINTNPEIKIYPNPAYDVLNISSTHKIMQVNIINLFGQTVFSQTHDMTKSTIYVDGLPPGIYAVRVKDHDGWETVNKFVKE